MADRRTKSRRRLAARSDLPPTDRRLRAEPEERARGGFFASSRRRAMAIAGVLVVVAVGAGGAWLALAGPGDRGPGASPTARTEIDEIRLGPHLVFQNVLRDEDYAEVSIARLVSSADRRVSTGLVCERVHFAGGQGICLAGEHGAASSYFAIPFGADFATRDPIALAGSPNLARVSADGRYGAASVITTQASEVTDAVNGAVLIDMTSGTIIAESRRISRYSGRRAVRSLRLRVLGRHVLTGRQRPLLRHPPLGGQHLSGRGSDLPPAHSRSSMRTYRLRRCRPMDRASPTSGR